MLSRISTVKKNKASFALSHYEKVGLFNATILLNFRKQLLQYRVLSIGELGKGTQVENVHR